MTSSPSFSIKTREQFATTSTVSTVKCDVLSLRLERLQALGRFSAQTRAALDLLPRGVPYLESAMETVMEFLGRCRMPGP